MSQRTTNLRVIARLGLVLLAISAWLQFPAAMADPAPGARITDIQRINARWDKVSVFSPTMNKVIVNDVYKAPGGGAPTFYLLPGIDGGDNLDPGTSFAPGTKSWFGMTDIQGFFANKYVNVVSPLGGQFSWWTDWIGDPAKQYQTYMTRELPPLINATYNTNGRNAVGGLSTGARLGWTKFDPENNPTYLILNAAQLGADSKCLQSSGRNI